KPATKTRVTSGGVRPGYATVVKAAEGTRARAGLNVLRREPVVRARKPSRVWTPMEIAGVTTEIAAIDERPAVGNVGVVVIDDRAVMPVESPVMPSPTKAAEVADSETYTEPNRRAADENAGNRIPSRPHR